LLGVIAHIDAGAIRFAYRSATLDDAALAWLAELAARLREEPTVRIRVNGHTDSDGGLEENTQLSARRAAAVIEVLVAAGVSRDRIEGAGLGELQPVASNSDEAGQQQNRRVEVVLLGAAGGGP
jgi:outer membrane protein OmpA-like peptidoglycan-associated protein